MLVLSRKVGEKITIGENIVIQVVRNAKNKVRIGIEAPKELVVRRMDGKEKEEAA